MTVHSWDRSGKERGDDGGCMWPLDRDSGPCESERDRKMGNVTCAWTPKAIKEF